MPLGAKVGLDIEKKELKTYRINKLRKTHRETARDALLEFIVTT